MKKFFLKQPCKIILFLTLVAASVIAADEPDSTNAPPNYNAVIPSLNFKDTDIRDILRAVAFEFKTNIVVENKINARVSIALFNTPVYEAVKMIAQDNGFEYEFDKNRFYVKTPEIREEPKPFEFKPEVAYDPLMNKIMIRVSNTPISEFVEELRQVTNSNFLLTPGTSGNLYGSLRDIDFETGVRNLLQNNGFAMFTRDSIYYVTKSSYYSSLDNETTGSAHYWVSAKNNKVTIDVTNGDVNKIIDDIANQLDLQIIKLASPNATATIKCTEVSVEKAMNYLLKGTNFTFKHENETFVIGETGNKNLDNVRLVKLFHLRADIVEEKIPKELFSGVNITISKEHNALILTGENETITNLENYVSEIDQPVPQVMIEALVVDYNLDNLFEFGIEAGRGDSVAANRPDKWYPGIDATASGNKINQLLKDVGNINLFGTDINVGKLGKLPEDFFLNIRMLEQDGVANVRSRPLLSTLNGNTAYLKVGTIQNYVFKDILPVTNQLSSTFIEKERIQQIEATISFEITPWVGPNNQLTLIVKPDFQTPVGEFSPDKNLIPSINTRTMESTVRLKDGETIVLGGLIQDIESTSISKFPFLGDIPIIGEFFTNRKKNKTKAELVIYLTPRIFYEDEFGYANYEYGEIE